MLTLAWVTVGGLDPRSILGKQEIIPPKSEKKPYSQNLKLLWFSILIISCKLRSQPGAARLLNERFAKRFANTDEPNLISRVETWQASHSTQMSGGWWPQSRSHGCSAHQNVEVFSVWGTISTATRQCDCSTWTLGMEKPWRCSSTAFCKHVPRVSNGILRSAQTATGPFLI